MATIITMTTDIHNKSDALQSALGLLYLSSPALPIGAFAYSQGLENAIDRGWVKNKESLSEWVEHIMAHGLSKLDLPLLLRLRECVRRKDQVAFDEWNLRVQACRESAELLAEEINLGQSLARLISTQGLDEALGISLPQGKPTYLAGLALAGIKLGLDDAYASMSFCWSWLENQLTVACKTIPLGQTDAQGILLGKRQLIVMIAGAAQMAENDFCGSSLPGQAMLSALHETQYSRLFRS